MSFLSRWRRRIASLPRPTPTGSGFLGLTAVVGLIAFLRGGGVELLLFGLFGAAAIVSAAMSMLNLRGLAVDRFMPDHAHAGQAFEVDLLVRLAGRSGDAFGVVVTDGEEGPYTRPGHALALRVSRGAPAALHYRTRIKERGRHAITACRLSTRFPFGFFEYSVVRQVQSEVLVYPRVGIFRQDPLPGSRFSRLMTSTETVREKGAEEFAQIREYRPGDNPRLVAWKSTARHGRLMVKELEDDLTKKVTIFLETRLRPGARSSVRFRLERTISFAATLLKELCRRRYLVQLHAFGPEPVRIAAGKGPAHLDRLLACLAEIRPTETEAIDRLVATASAESLVTTLPVLILPDLEEGPLRAALVRISGRKPPVVFHMDGHWERSIFGYHESPFARLGR